MKKFMVGTVESLSPKGAQKALKDIGIDATVKNILAGQVAECIIVDDETGLVDPAPTQELDLAHKDEMAIEEDKVLLPEVTLEDKEVDEPSPDFTADQFMEDIPDHIKAASIRDKADEDAIPDAKVDDVEYPERGTVADVKAMKKIVKKLKDHQLAEWCELEGATYTPSDHESINRMRMAMAIKAIYFPETAPKSGSKSKSKYGDYSTEELVQMALDNDVSVKDDKGNMQILRMYTIMALKEAGILG